MTIRWNITNYGCWRWLHPGTLAIFVFFAVVLVVSYNVRMSICVVHNVVIFAKFSSYSILSYPSIFVCCPVLVDPAPAAAEWLAVWLAIIVVEIGHMNFYSSRYDTFGTCCALLCNIYFYEFELMMVGAVTVLYAMAYLLHVHMCACVRKMRRTVLNACNALHFSTPFYWLFTNGILLRTHTLTGHTHTFALSLDNTKRS